MSKESSELIESLERHLEALKASTGVEASEGESQEAIKKALRAIDTYAAHDDPQQLKWLVNRIVELLTITPEAYALWVKQYERVDEDGDPIYMWEKGSL